MKKNLIVEKVIPVFLAGVIFLTSCASTTMIQSIPNGAKVYLNEEPAGTAPYLLSDTKITGTTTRVKLEKEGYEPLYSSITRNEEADLGAIICGFFFCVPFLWTMQYKPSHTYELKPVEDKD